jgi:hypothetical protein
LDTVIEDAYATGRVEGQDHVGGLVGQNRTGSTISRTFATGFVVAPETAVSIGGLVGLNDTETDVVASFYDRENTGQTDSGKGAPTSQTAMKQIDTFADAGWSISCRSQTPETVWGITDSYPFLTAFVGTSFDSCPDEQIQQRAVKTPRNAGETVVSADLFSPSPPSESGGPSPSQQGDNATPDTTVSEEGAERVVPLTTELTESSDGSTPGNTTGGSPARWLWAIGVGGVLGAALIAGGATWARTRV